MINHHPPSYNSSKSNDITRVQTIRFKTVITHVRCIWSDVDIEGSTWYIEKER